MSFVACGLTPYRRRRGAALTEICLLIGLVVVIGMVSLKELGTRTRDKLNEVSEAQKNPDTDDNTCTGFHCNISRPF
ncbi:MAG: hypothetical protein J5J00_11210 [Deltaproteobacteria bacterium]|nr:hypothetical protein [Deltaproteobacteria bacterium]